MIAWPVPQRCKRCWRANPMPGMPIEHRHEWICDQVIANAMLDRVMQIHHRFILTGESMRRNNPPAKEKIDNYFK
ncbi:MAG: ATP-binding protein [Polaromonas sp.]|nr:ATP-binding protein [Polaromonas sp.]